MIDPTLSHLGNDRSMQNKLFLHRFVHRRRRLDPKRSARRRALDIAIYLQRRARRKPL